MRCGSCSAVVAGARECLQHLDGAIKVSLRHRNLRKRGAFGPKLDHVRVRTRAKQDLEVDDTTGCDVTADEQRG